MLYKMMNFSTRRSNNTAAQLIDCSFNFTEESRRGRLVLIFVLTVIISNNGLVVNSATAPINNSNNITLTDVINLRAKPIEQLQSSRFKRQDTPQTTPATLLPGATGDGLASSAGDEHSEEGLSSLKCDFDSPDPTDLCQFKVLPMPLGVSSKSGSTWSHGSGKMALYQGGPLVDSSRNDSSGGYIFYETSNPYINQQQNNSMMSLSGEALIRQENLYDFIYGKQNQQGQTAGGRMGLQLYQPLSSISFVSPNLTAPVPSGMCLSFQYIIHGLSAEELKININDHKSERSRQIWSSSESAQNNWTLGEVLYSVANVHSVSFSASSLTHAPKDIQQRKFRGYIALDDVEVARHDPANNQGPCRGHCNFDGDLCGWTNADNGPDDDFDWTFGRSSDNLFTGPPRDYTSSTNNELTGSYLFTDSSYPRHPGDRAILISPLFQPTAVNEAMCMRFAVHMFGSGIGTLAIKIRYSGAEVTSTGDNKNSNTDQIIWEMAGDAGNNWHQAQTSVSSSKQPFQVVIEGIIGENHFGNIAIDEISFSAGACPTSPPVASKNYGDCTFEQSMCYWKNSGPEAHLDDLDWVRSGDEQTIHGPNFDHTSKKRSGSYLKLENTYREPKSGSRAFLLSPVFQPKMNPATGNSVQCLSFYYYMFLKSVSPSGPNLGTIRIYLATNNELIPIWRLTNPITSPNWKQGRAVLSTSSIDGQPIAPTKFFQIAFEGVWGDAASGAIAIDDITIFDGACDILPHEAKSVAGECSFDADMCSWSNKTFDASTNDLIDGSKSPFFQSVNSQHTAIGGGKQTRKPGWQLATVDLRPVNLQDHTYKAPIGYAFVDVFDASTATQSLILQGAEVSVGEGQHLSMCLSFWFAGFGRSELNRLSVHLTQASKQQQQSSNDNSGAPASLNNRSNQNTPSGQSTTSGQQTTSGTPASPSSGANTGSSSLSGQNIPSSNNAVVNSNAESTGNNSQGDEIDPNAWKMVKGNLLWSVSLKNITEVNGRKWLYGQVSIKADSNFIIRYEANSSDGGFALDDISFYEGPCETRPAHAKVSSTDDESVGQN